MLFFTTKRIRAASGVFRPQRMLSVRHGLDDEVDELEPSVIARRAESEIQSRGYPSAKERRNSALADIAVCTIVSTATSEQSLA
jgi:hypothetical protein